MAVVDENPDRVLLAFACSDGALRLVSITEKAKVFITLEKIFNGN